MNIGTTAESIVGSLFAAAQAERESVDFIRARIEQRIGERGFRRDVCGECYSDLVETLAQAEHDGLGVFLSGRPGVGKTFLARCAFPSAPLVQCSQVGDGFELPDAPSSSSTTWEPSRRRSVASPSSRRSSAGMTRHRQRGRA